MPHEPCEACGRPFVGRSGFAYPCVKTDSAKLAKRVRLCPADMRTFLSNVRDHMLDKNDVYRKDDWDGFTCNWCKDEQISPGAPVAFVTVYPAKDQRRDYMAWLCEKCAGRAPRELLLDLS